MKTNNNSKRLTTEELQQLHAKLAIEDRNETQGISCLLNNNERLITPNKVTATVEVIGEPNHHYNHTVSFYNVRTTVYHDDVNYGNRFSDDWYFMENDYDDNV